MTTFKDNTRELARYEIGTIIDYCDQRSMIVGIFNVPNAGSSDPYLAIIPEDGLERYYELMKHYPVHNGNKFGSKDYINFMQRPDNPRAVAAAKDIFVIPLADIFEEFPPIGEPREVSSYVSGLRPAAKKFPIGSTLIADSYGATADGIFLGLNQQGRPTLFMTLYNSASDETRDYINVVEQAVKRPNKRPQAKPNRDPG